MQAYKSFLAALGLSLSALLPLTTQAGDVPQNLICDECDETIGNDPWRSFEGKEPAHFDMTGLFNLNGIGPLDQASFSFTITDTVGVVFSQSLPAGSLQHIGGGRFKLPGPGGKILNGGLVVVEISPHSSLPHHYLVHVDAFPEAFRDLIPDHSSPYVQVRVEIDGKTFCVLTNASRASSPPGWKVKSF